MSCDMQAIRNRWLSKSLAQQSKWMQFPKGMPKKFKKTKNEGKK